MMQKPTRQQLHWQRNHSLAIFCHFGINTFYGMEWSDGSLPPAAFYPADLNCRAWVKLAADVGAAHIILTAKHHDGFCLWPTATTEYSVASSPWRNGQGDIVRELAEACRDEGIGLGLYLSPWDRHDPDWHEDPTAYDARYIQQLTELCTQYGPLVELWFDGAGSEQHPYDWPAIMAVVHEHQPDAMVFNMGEPTIRWVGNEDGLAADPVWYVTDEIEKSIYDDSADLIVGGERYCPPECDVPIRRHWFWQPDDEYTLKSLNHLLAIWYRSVGLGANLLLNVGPDRTGRIDRADESRLREFGAELARRFGEPISSTIRQENDHLEIEFDSDVEFDHLVLRERLEEGQRITRHRVLLANGTVLVDGVQSVGVQRVHVFPTVKANKLIIEIEGENGELESVTAFRTGVEVAPELEVQPPFIAEKFEGA